MADALTAPASLARALADCTRARARTSRYAVHCALNLAWGVSMLQPGWTPATSSMCCTTIVTPHAPRRAPVAGAASWTMLWHFHFKTPLPQRRSMASLLRCVSRVGGMVSVAAPGCCCVPRRGASRRMVLQVGDTKTFGARPKRGLGADTPTYGDAFSRAYLQGPGLLRSQDAARVRPRPRGGACVAHATPGRRASTVPVGFSGCRPPHRRQSLAKCLAYRGARGARARLRTRGRRRLKALRRPCVSPSGGAGWRGRRRGTPSPGAARLRRLQRQNHETTVRAAGAVPRPHTLWAHCRCWYLADAETSQVARHGPCTCGLKTGCTLARSRVCTAWWRSSSSQSLVAVPAARHRLHRWGLGAHPCPASAGEQMLRGAPCGRSRSRALTW